MRTNVRMTQADKIIQKFGGLTATSKALGHQNPTTVQGWKERGFIPMRQLPRLIEAAKRKEIALSLADFLTPEGAPAKLPKSKARPS